MTVPLSNSSGQPNPGLAQQDRPGMGFSLEAGLSRDDRNPGTGGEEELRAAAFAMQLATVRAANALASTDDNDLAVVAAAPPPPVIFGLEVAAEADPVLRKAEVQGLAQTLMTEVAASDRIRLGGSGQVTLTLPLNAPALGLSEARLMVGHGELTIVFPMRAGTDAAVVNAALGELAQLLAQRFPTRTIRLRGEDDVTDRPNPAEFNPFKEPVGRRK